MELRYLRTFVAVAETLNISAAARQLRVTQPALSRHIHALEDLVGHALFVRHRDGLRLTPPGISLRDHGVKALAAVEEALRNARGAEAGEDVTLRLGYYGSISIWASILAPATESFGRRFPRVTFSVAEGSSAQLAANLRDGLLDVALLGPGDHGPIPNVGAEVACTFPALAMMAANHRLAKKRLVSLEEMRDEEFIGVRPELEPGRYRTLIEACQSIGFSPRIVNVASSLPELIMEVKRRMGVALVGPFVTTAPHPGVVFTKFKPPCVPMDIRVAYALHGTPALRELAGLVVAEAARVVNHMR